MESIYGKNKDYLSFSSVRLWKQSKDRYRAHYYEAAPGIDTVYTRFGKEIAEALESRDFAKYPSLHKVPFYSVSEQPLDVFIEGIRVVAYLDLYEPEAHTFGEVKTGKSKAWDAVKVHKWEQLPWYSLLIKEATGKVNNLCHLIWLETEFEAQKGILRNQTLTLTGRMEVFPRRITAQGRKKIRNEIIQIAKEIKEDYETYERAKSGILLNGEAKRSETSVQNKERKERVL